MAYKTERPSRGIRNLNRPSASSAKSDYASSLVGLSSSLSDLRKQLVEDQIAQIDYEIEVGTASPEEKIALYEDYISGITEGTQEWFRVSTKIQNLKDSAGTEDFAIAKSLYAGSQISAEQYYRILKERAAETGLSQKEQRLRTTDLWEFERKMGNETTDTTLRDSLAQEEMGLITAGDRLSILQQAFSKETDPDRKENLKFQILTQQKKVYKEDLSLRELYVRKGIQEGVNTKEDLLPIYAEKMQTAFTTEDALQAEISYQTLVKDIQGDYVAMFERGSKETKKMVNAQIGTLDKKIEQAKRTGDITGLALLYENKRVLIEDFFNTESVALDDKLKSSNMLNFLKNTYGMDVDLETGNVINIAPTDELNIQNIEDALMNPDSSVLVRSTSPGGDATFKLVRGEKIQVTQPDGSVKSFYDFGNNIAVSRLDPSLTKPVIDPLTGEAVLDANGQPVLAPALPSGRSLQKLPEGYQQALQSGNLKPLSGEEFKGEYVELYKDAEGNPVRGYLVYGDKYKDVLGAQPVEGKPGTYLLTTKAGEIPSQKYIADNKLFNPTSVEKFVLGAGALAQKFIPDPIESVVRTATNLANPLDFVQRKTREIIGQNKSGEMDASALNIKNKIDSLKAPNVDAITSNVSGGVASLLSQLTSSVFKPSQQTILKPITQSLYKNALQTTVNTALKQTPLYNTFKTAENVFTGAKNLVSKGLSFLGLGGK